jgi:N-methylhydantoinase A
MRRVVVPLSNFASGWSAFGIASSDVVVVKEASVALDHPFDPAQLNDHWAALERDVVAAMERQEIPLEQTSLQRTVEMRYAMQVNQVEVEAPDGSYDADVVEGLVAAFERQYERVYGEGTGYADAGFTMTALRVRGSASLTRVELTPGTDDGGGAAPAPPRKGERDVVWYGGELAPVATPIYDGAGFRPGMQVRGPAIVEYPDTTVVLWDGDVARVDPLGSLAIELDTNGKGSR